MGLWFIGILADLVLRRLVGFPRAEAALSRRFTGGILGHFSVYSGGIFFGGWGYFWELFPLFFLILGLFFKDFFEILGNFFWGEEQDFGGFLVARESFGDFLFFLPSPEEEKGKG